ncbi:microfibril-associated glycoprotein 4-like [Ruditapes philippinarum]|uniref:microfibril-associated glycoprotein 4-like n=1 Tax=Ruditapes philippinarum TaxID=129788 RepID=UPI00295BF9E5|nr:microfibril-associated glycoprotein 4-like [Ruditapes philippinarum]
MQGANNAGVYTTVGDREYHAYDSLQLSEIGLYNEVTEIPGNVTVHSQTTEGSKALQVIREDYVSKRLFVGVVAILTALLVITLTVLVYNVETSKQKENLEYSKCEVKANDTGCGSVPNVTNGHLSLVNSSQSTYPTTAIVTCNFGYEPSKSIIICQDNGKWEAVYCKMEVIDCKYILDDTLLVQDGIYEIPLWSFNSWLSVYCDMSTDGGGWTVIQNRFDGSVDFYRNFSEYENGFGDLNGEFWLGLKHIQKLASNGRTEIRLEMTRNSSEEGFETFKDFKLVDGDEYRLHINEDSATRSSGISANVSFAYNNGSPFSTYDRDMDRWLGESCAQRRHGGWWYNYCTFVNLNGRYCDPGSLCTASSEGHNHRGFALSESLLNSRMMLRRIGK